MTNEQLQLKVDRARWWALQNHCFYAQCAMGLTDSFNTPHGVDTAATDGRKIYWNSAFLSKLTDEETRFVLLHEALHCAHIHLFRLPHNDLGNVAGDYEINLLLSKIPSISMPKGGLLDKQWENKACEEIYAALNRQPNKGKSEKEKGKSDPGGCGGFMEPAPDEEGKDEQGKSEKEKGKSGPGKPGNGNPGTGKIGAQTLKEEWEQRVIQAAQAAKASGQGTLPGDAERMLERLSRTDIDWRQELADFTKSVIGSRNDWSRSNRRMATAPCIYPRKRITDTGLLVCVRDTSGSITDALCSEFTALIAGAAAEMNATVILIDCDTGIRAERRIEPGEEFPLDAPGGGGSDFRILQQRIDEIVEGGEVVSGLIVCTDLMIEEPEAINAPALWLSTTDRIAKTGRTVRILL